MFTPDQTLKTRLESWIAQNSEPFFRDIAALVNIRSVSAPDETYPFGAGCAQVLEKALAMARGYGFPGENIDWRCGVSLHSGTGRRKGVIGLFSHLDVVPEGEGWGSDPYCCTDRDGFLIGRGVSDNKGPAVVALYAMRFLKESGITLQHDLHLFFGCAEETGMEDIEYYVKNRKTPDFALVADNNYPVCFGEKGILRFTASRKVSGNLREISGAQVVNVVPDKAVALLEGVSISQARARLADTGLTAEACEGGVRFTAHGLSRHAAFPEGSVNALHLLADGLSRSGLAKGETEDALARIARLTSDPYGECTGAPFADEVSGRLTCVGSMAHIENGVLSLCYDVRYPVTAKGESVRAALAARFLEEGFTLSALSDDPPSYLPPDEPLVPALCDIAAYVLGKRYEPYTMGGGTYARKLPRAIGFGPNVPGEQNPFPPGHGQGHQPDECMRKDSLLDGIRAYVYALTALDHLL